MDTTVSRPVLAGVCVFIEWEVV